MAEYTTWCCSNGHRARSGGKIDFEEEIIVLYHEATIHTRTSAGASQ